MILSKEVMQVTCPDERDREDEALDALIVAAFRSEGGDDIAAWEETDPESVLSDEDKRALEVLGPDLVSRILSGRPLPKAGEAKRGEILEELSGAMNRGEEGSGLTDKAREEIERKIREREAEKEQKEGEGRGD